MRSADIVSEARKQPHQRNKLDLSGLQTYLAPITLCRHVRYGYETMTHLTTPALLRPLLLALAPLPFSIAQAQDLERHLPPVINLAPTSTASSPVQDYSRLPKQTLRTDTATYEGHFKVESGGSVTGTLTIHWKNGTRYQGQMVNGKRQGQGSFVWTDGQQYQGHWENDQPHGHGTLTFPNGDVYVGNVRAGVPDGVGTLTEKSGNRFQGNWKMGHKEGYGIYTWATGQVYEGDWSHDRASGHGALTMANGDRYRGSILNALPEGKGEETFASGDSYTGSFSHGLPNGLGVYRWKSGDHYEGAWQKGHKSGQGRYTWADGDYWEGIFMNDRKASGRLYFKPHLEVPASALDALIQQTQARIDIPRPTRNPPLDQERLRQIPMVAIELQSCSGKTDKDGCRNRTLQAIAQHAYFHTDWQTVANSTDAAPTLQADRHSISEIGRVFSWIRTLSPDHNQTTEIGFKYECDTRKSDIQLVYHCNGQNASATCSLDQDFDSYVGKPLTIDVTHDWFGPACQRGAN